MSTPIDPATLDAEVERFQQIAQQIRDYLAISHCDRCGSKCLSDSGPRDPARHLHCEVCGWTYYAPSIPMGVSLAEMVAARNERAETHRVPAELTAREAQALFDRCVSGALTIDQAAEEADRSPSTLCHRWVRMGLPTVTRARRSRRVVAIRGGKR
jgi:hypothetical protein